MKELVPVVGIICFIASIICFVIVFKNKKKTKKIKTPLVFGIILFGICGILVTLSDTWSIKSIKVNDLNVDKEKTVSIKLIIDPTDYAESDIKCSVVDKEIASISNLTVKGLSDGNTTYSCKINDVTSNEGKIVVNLTKEEILEKEEKRKKEEQQKAEKEKEKKESEFANNANVLSTTESIAIRDYCKDVINSTLKSPSTADYPDSTFGALKGWNMAKKNNLVTIASYVDSQNGFGAMVRSNFIMQVKINNEGNGKATYVKINGDVVLGKYQK